MIDTGLALIFKRALRPGMIRLVLIFILYAGFSKGQSHSPDRIYAHLDKPFYVSGETLYFKVYLFNPEPSPTTFLHAELVDGNGNVFCENLLEVNNNSGYGSLAIPLSLAQDRYFFRIYSNWNFNFEEGFNFICPVSIFNDFELTENGSPGYSTLRSAQSRKELNRSALEILVKNERAIHTRDRILIQVRNRENTSGRIRPSVSISVLDTSLCGIPDPDFMFHAFSRKAALPAQPVETSFQPEKQLLVKGTIRELNTGHPVNSKILSVYNTDTYEFTRITSTGGEFSIEIPPANADIVLQVINMNPFEPIVNQVDKKYPGIILNLPDPIVDVPGSGPVVSNYLYHSRLRRKIKEMYSENLIDSMEFSIPDELPFDPDRSYLTDKYQLLKNVEEFMREAVINTSHIEENGRRKILLYNQETKKYFMRSPWFIVDGKFIFDDSLCYNIPFNRVRKIDVYNRSESILKYFDPVMVQGGVVAVYTINQYLGEYAMSQPNTLIITGLKPAQNRPQNQREEDRLNSEPGLSPEICWMPDVLLNMDGRAEVEFNANDVSGTFLIHIEGMDASGRPLSGQKVIRILP